jgi:hypothetical protein
MNQKEILRPNWRAKGLPTKYVRELCIGIEKKQPKAWCSNLNIYIALRYKLLKRPARIQRSGTPQGGTMPDGYVDRRVATRMSWPAIFAGTFVFLAIEVTFGVLGTAVFASAANPSSAHPVSGMSAGIGIWLVILSIISLYFGGRVAAALSGTAISRLGMYHGLVTFGVSVFTSVLVAALVLGTTTIAPAASVVGTNAITVSSIVATAGYWLFIALLLGMIAAAIGGSQAINRLPVQRTETESPSIRRVA